MKKEFPGLEKFKEKVNARRPARTSRRGESGDGQSDSIIRVGREGETRVGTNLIVSNNHEGEKRKGPLKDS